MKVPWFFDENVCLIISNYSQFKHNFLIAICLAYFVKLSELFVTQTQSTNIFQAFDGINRCLLIIDKMIFLATSEDEFDDR